jgi:hypothetical protein
VGDLMIRHRKHRARTGSSISSRARP